MEFRSDGTKNILRPSHMSLARVSVLRGEGEMEGKPFIDDYIHTSEAVVDYLTEFSGIEGESNTICSDCMSLMTCSWGFGSKQLTAYPCASQGCLQEIKIA